MKENVKHFVHTCVKCQNMKSIYKKKYGLYRPLLIPSEPWNRVSMYFMMQLLEWNGCHFGSSKLIFQVGENHSNKHYHNQFQFNEVFFWHVG